MTFVAAVILRVCFALVVLSGIVAVVILFVALLGDPASRLWKRMRPRVFEILHPRITFYSREFIRYQNLAISVFQKDQKAYEEYIRQSLYYKKKVKEWNERKKKNNKKPSAMSEDLW